MADDNNGSGGFFGDFLDAATGVFKKFLDVDLAKTQFQIASQAQAADRAEQDDQAPKTGLTSNALLIGGGVILFAGLAFLVLRR